MKHRSRAALAAGSLLLLCGCASGDGGNIWGEYYQVLKQSIAGSFGDRVVTREQAAAIPYASLGYRLNGGPQMLLVLATDTNGDQLWTSAAHVVLLTHDGRLLRTVGLPDDISGVMPAMGNSLPPPAAILRGAFTSIRAVDFPGLGTYSVPLACEMRMVGHESVAILGQPVDTVKAEESCKSTSLRWSFQDDYWLDPSSGFVWQSLQHLTPKGDAIQIQILRPPG